MCTTEVSRRQLPLHLLVEQYSGVATGEHWGNNPKFVGVFIYYCNDVKKRPQRGCSIQLVATETADAIMAISVQGNYVIEITVKININE